jgi:hypothetical protein
MTPAAKDYASVVRLESVQKFFGAARCDAGADRGDGPAASDDNVGVFPKLAAMT